MESEQDHLVRGAAPLASMMSKVAELWRAQGDEFLEQTHADVIDDVMRLRDSSIEEEDEPESALRDRQHRLSATVGTTVHRLSEWDHAVMEGLRAWREKPADSEHTADDDVVDLRAPDSFVDLTSDEPTVTEVRTDGVCAKHSNHASVAPCRKCGNGFCDDYLLRPGAKVAPLCLDCALVLSGIRRHN
jgi:hypothetical protein